MQSSDVESFAETPQTTDSLTQTTPETATESESLSNFYTIADIIAAIVSDVAATEALPDGFLGRHFSIVNTDRIGYNPLSSPGDGVPFLEGWVELLSESDRFSLQAEIAQVSPLVLSSSLFKH